jgi:hypothetical protein
MERASNILTTRRKLPGFAEQHWTTDIFEGEKWDELKADNSNELAVCYDNINSTDAGSHVAVATHAGDGQ